MLFSLEAQLHVKRLSLQARTQDDPGYIASFGSRRPFLHCKGHVPLSRRRRCRDIQAEETSSDPSTVPSRRLTIGTLGALVSVGFKHRRVLAQEGRRVAPGQSSSEHGPTNEVVRVVDGVRQKRLGNSDIVVSELGLGSQRWCSTDFNAPDEVACFKLMDRAILGSGVNLIDTAEQYPIPSDDSHPEGATEQTIGRWIAKEPGRRRKVVVATKITGGFNINAKNIQEDCEGSLQRLRTDYLDLYQLHWPQRYSPQSNWGQSLTYQYDMEGNSGMEGASFEELVMAMGKLHKEGKIRGWGLCNDNAFGLTACCEVAKRLGVPRPVSFQGDYSILDRKSEENGVFEASSPIHENVGFLGYNALAGGYLTGKYLDSPPAIDEVTIEAAKRRLRSPRGRHDDLDWGSTLYRYRSAAAERATKAYKGIADRSGLTLAELSLRWCRQRTGCTSVLLGTSNLQQLEEDLQYFKNPKPLPQEVMWEVDRVHLQNRLPIFSSESAEADWLGRGEIGEPIP